MPVTESINFDVNSSPSPVVPVAWDQTVFFNVEDTIFPVPRHRLTQHKVFADMFLLPISEADGAEGRDRAHPIHLEGYKALGFNALLSVLYPTPQALFSGSLTLSKEEWIGVLNLSTRWQMKEIRTYSINNLSTLSLSSLEKVDLARSYKVAKWLWEGLTEIASVHPLHSLDVLQTQLGLETTCRVLWIRDQLNSPGPGIHLTLGSLGCGSCGSPTFTENRECRACSRTIGVDDLDAIQFWHDVSSVSVTRRSIPEPCGSASVVIKLDLLNCKYCKRYPLLLTTWTCPSCRQEISYENFRLVRSKQPQWVERSVKEAFSDEIAEYESLDIAQSS